MKLSLIVENSDLINRATKILDAAELPSRVRAACDAVVSWADQQRDFTYTDRPTFNKDQILDEIASGKRLIADSYVISERESWITLDRGKGTRCGGDPINTHHFTFDEVNEMEKDGRFTFIRKVGRPPTFIQKQMQRGGVSVPVTVGVTIYQTNNEFVPIILSALSGANRISGPATHLIYGRMYGYGLEKSVPYAETR